ncbi:hypothetical protein [Phenylobacterium sp.]|jgi:hypothetical protein|uniref:hypothetical protein n=1 Tax=Phenylobacterium sp. TaxID=1871053 RepID=UPI002F3F7EB0
MTRRGKITAGLLGAAALAASPSLAKQTEPPPAAAAPAPTVSGVVVNGQKADPLVDRTSEFVRQHLPQSVITEQYPRFHVDVCVKVVGLPEGFDAFVAKRVVEVAKEVGAPVAKAADCTPNVNVVFTTEPAMLMSDIAKRKDILLGFYYSQAQFKKLRSFTRPVEARYVTRNIDQFGNSRLEIHDPLAWTDPPHGRAGSRLTASMSTEIMHSLIVADAGKAAGEKIDTVADYIAVLALARWSGIERCNGLPTILNRLADDCPDAPDAATPQDLALLKGLYSVDPRENGSQQRATIASAIRKATAAETRELSK